MCDADAQDVSRMNIGCVTTFMEFMSLGNTLIDPNNILEELNEQETVAMMMNVQESTKPVGVDRIKLNTTKRRWRL